MPNIESPGSLNDFQGQHPELSNEEAKAAYGSALDVYRKVLATEIGVTAAELHEEGFRLANVILNEGEQAA